MVVVVDSNRTTFEVNNNITLSIYILKVKFIYYPTGKGLHYYYLYYDGIKA